MRRSVLVAVLALGLAVPLRGRADDAGAPLELRTGIPLELHLPGGTEARGTFLGVEGDDIRLATADGVRMIPFSLVESLTVEGHGVDRQALEAAMVRWTSDYVPPDLAHPSPALVGALSAVWAGAGYLPLGQPQAFLSWSAFEAVVLGSAAITWSQGGRGAVIPFAALDLLLHGIAVDEVVRESKRRHRIYRVSLSVQPGVVGLVLSEGGTALPPGVAWGLQDASKRDPGLDR